MTTPQKISAVALLTAATCVGVYEARRASRLLGEIQGLKLQQALLVEQVQQSQQERDEAKRQLAVLRDEKQRSGPNTAELLKLRGDVGVLRKQLAESNTAKTQSPAPIVQASQPADLLEQQKRTARIKGLDGRNYAMHFLSFAWDNQ